MGLNDQSQKKVKSPLKQNNEDRLVQLQKTMLQNQILMCEHGVDADELPNGHGEFGLALSNPIPCHTILGGRLYLDQLRTNDGSKVNYQRTGSYFFEAIKHPIDGYLLSHPNGTTLATIYISSYQKRNSIKSPKGFYLAEHPLS